MDSEASTAPGENVERGVPRPRHGVPAILLCPLLGALLGSVAGVVMAGTPDDRAWDLVRPFLLLPSSQEHGFLAIAGGVYGSVAGVLLTPFLLFEARARRRRTALVTAWLCLPVAALSGRVESPFHSLGIVLVAAVATFLAVSAANRVPRMPGWVRALITAAPALLAVAEIVPIVQRRWAATESVPALLELMRGDDSQVAWRAVARLEEVGGRAALLDALDHPHPNVRFQVAGALRHHPSAEVLRALSEALDDPVPWVAARVEASLWEVGGSAPRPHVDGESIPELAPLAPQPGEHRWVSR